MEGGMEGQSVRPRIGMFHELIEGSLFRNEKESWGSRGVEGFDAKDLPLAEHEWMNILFYVPMMLELHCLYFSFKYLPLGYCKQQILLFA